MKLEDFKEHSAVKTGAWADVWPALQKVLMQRLFERARAIDVKAGMAVSNEARQNELALLIEDLGKVALPSAPPTKAPTMPRLSSMG